MLHLLHSFIEEKVIFYNRTNLIKRMKKILVIEDNPEVRENLEELLLLSNYEVLTAENGKIGADLAIQHQPDLILCDVMMPELDGYGVLRILGKRVETADIPFIFLTARADKSDFRRGMKLGADDYITKPFDDVDLLDAVEMRLKKSERLRSISSSTESNFSTFLQEVKSYEAFQHLTADQELRRYRKKDLIFEEGSYPHQVFYIESGVVKVYKTNEHGKELILEILKEGDFVGFIPLISASKYGESAAAMEECQLRLIPKAEFLDLLYQDQNVSAHLIKMLANEITEKEVQLISLAYNSVRRRVADALLQLFEKFETDGRAEFAILRDDLASLAGTTKETVIRTLSEFKDDGFIIIDGHRIIIEDASKLSGLPY